MTDLLVVAAYLAIGIWVFRAIAFWKPSLFEQGDYDVTNGVFRVAVCVLLWWAFLAYQVIEQFRVHTLQGAKDHRAMLVQRNKELAAAMRELEGLPERRRREDSFYARAYHRRIGDSV